MEDKNQLKKELALILTLGLTALKGTPYLKIFANKLGITKEQFKYLKSLSIIELEERYSNIDNMNIEEKGG